MHQSIDLSADFLPHDMCLQDFVFIQLNLGLRKKGQPKSQFLEALRQAN